MTATSCGTVSCSSARPEFPAERDSSMGGQRLAGTLWLIAGISSGGISNFLVDPLDLAISIGGAAVAQ